MALKNAKGRPVNASHSTLEDFHHRGSCGCPRYVYFGKVKCVDRGPMTPAQKLGTDVHSVLEEHLGGDPAPADASDQAKAIAERAKRLIPTDLVGLKPEVWVRNVSLPVEPGVRMPFVGAVDVHGYREDGSLEVIDFKTRSSPRWAPDENALRTDRQMLRYATALVLSLPEEPPAVYVRHINMLTKGVGEWTVGPVEVSFDAMERVWEETQEEAAAMYRVLKGANVASDVPAARTTAPCTAYNSRCPFWDLCADNPDNRTPTQKVPPRDLKQESTMNLEALKAKLRAKNAAQEQEASPEPVADAPATPSPDTEAPAAGEVPLTSKRPASIREAQARIRAIRQELPGADPNWHIDNYLRTESGLPEADWPWAKGTPALLLGWDANTARSWDEATRRRVETLGLKPDDGDPTTAEPPEAATDGAEPAAGTPEPEPAPEAATDGAGTTGQGTPEQVAAANLRAAGLPIGKDAAADIIKEALGLNRLRVKRVRAVLAADGALVMDEDGTIRDANDPAPAKPEPEPEAPVATPQAAEPEAPAAAPQAAPPPRVETIAVAQRVVYVGVLPVCGRPQPARATDMIAEIINDYEAQKCAGEPWQCSGDHFGAVRSIVASFRGHIQANGWPPEWGAGVFIPTKPPDVLHAEIFAAIQATADVEFRAVL